MPPDKIKLYTELLKSLTAFILGTGAGIYAMVIDGKLEGHQFFLYFVLILRRFRGDVCCRIYISRSKTLNQWTLLILC